MTNPDGVKRGHYKHRKDYIEELMQVLEFRNWKSATELMIALGIEKRYIFIQRYVIPAYEDGLVEFFMKNVPTQRNQLYRKTQVAAIRFGV